MKYRSRTEIIAQILEISLEGAIKTKIMYKAYLSHAQMKEYLRVLLTNGLMELDENQRFRTTNKAIRFLKIYQELGELSPKIKQMPELGG